MFQKKVTIVSHVSHLNEVLKTQKMVHYKINITKTVNSSKKNKTNIM